MSAALRFFQEAVILGFINGTEGRQAYRQCREDNGTAEDWVVQEGLLTPHQVQNVLSNMKQAEPDKKRKASKVRDVGPFKIVGKLGTGGMGTVYRAEQPSLNRQVAIKILATQFARDETFVQRFFREARAAARISHPNVVTCFDAGQEGDTLFMALELVEGGDAHQLRERSGGTLDEKRSLQITRDCAVGLDAIAQSGLVHRDIKPSNILLDRRGVAKLGDLGLARQMTEDDNISLSGEIFGTPAYMSPEHARGAKDLDIRTDIYSLGASLYTLLTGEQPFVGGSSIEIATKVLSDPTPDPRQHRPDLSRSACALVLRMMHKDRSLRYQTGAEVVSAIDRILNQGKADQEAHQQLDAAGAQLMWHQGAAVICPHGALGQNDSQHWRSVLEQAVAKQPTAVIINCLDVKWVSSEGLALLVQLKTACDQQQTPFAICNLNESTDKAIRCVQLHRLLPIFSDLDETVRELSAEVSKS